VRVDEQNAAPGLDVLDQQVAQQGRFADSGLAEQEHVLPAIGDREPEGHPAVPHVSLADQHVHIAKPSPPALRDVLA
jgi:hypothetical protein